MALTPMMAQYFSLKEQYPDTLLFFRLGDFYEMFGEDAKTASSVLGITLTSRDAGKDKPRIPMCGVPHHAAAGYLEKLVAQGFKVAVGEQLEDPKTAKGVVKRDVVQVITPGTYIDGSGEHRQSRYLAAAVQGPQEMGLAFVDLATGDFRTTKLDSREKLLAELDRVRPAELLATDDFLADGLAPWAEERGITITGRSSRILKRNASGQLLLDHFDVHTLDAFGLKDRVSIQSAAMALEYLQDTKKNALEHIRRLRVYQVDNFLHIDRASLANLEVFRSLGEGSRRHSLIGVLDHTMTSMGTRLLHQWLSEPLLDINAIDSRHEAVAALVAEESGRAELRSQLKTMADLERLLSRLVSGSGTPRDLKALQQSLAQTEPVKAVISGFSNSELLAATAAAVSPLPALTVLFEAALADEVPLNAKEGGIIRDGYNETLDQLRDAKRSGRRWIQELEDSERLRTGIKSLKVGYNKVFGYYIEVTKPNIAAAPDDYQRRQTLANCERFVTPELKEKETLILGAEERINQLEYELFAQLRSEVKQYVDSIQTTAQALAAVDVLQSLAEAAAKNHYCRPQLTAAAAMSVSEGRHPIIEAVQPGFVPNGLQLTEDEQVILLTGPNMAGKSTYLRQAALIVLMAQMGSFVPADAAAIGVVDKIFTRIGAGDDLSTGQSTFMVECAETAALIHNATASSLIILDELGRGTSTFDGMAIAQGVIEYIHDHIRARTLFSTHYHELTKLQETLLRLVTYRVEAEEARGQVFFLHKVVRGNADRSYGINVAKMAGIPKQIIRRSQDLLYQLEAGQKKPLQLDLFQSAQYAGRTSSQTEEAEEVAAQILSLDLQQTTPLEALQLLFKWRSLLEGR